MLVSRASSLPLVVIVGPTASGKTALAIDIAERHNGEIICADSRTVYKGLDIGTAKPTPADQARVPHHGLDLVEPDESFSAADFKSYANQKIAEIRQRGRMPVLVGGTGLYVDSVIYDYQFGPPVDKERRQELSMMTIEELHEYCHKHNVPLPENIYIKRYVVRSIEQQGLNQQRRDTPISNSIVVGISTDRDVLKQRIVQRASQLFAAGMLDEALEAGRKYGWDNEAMTGNIYRLARQYCDGELTLDRVKERFVTLDWQLAKRQLTWLKRREHIHWDEPDQLVEYLDQAIALANNS